MPLAGIRAFILVSSFGPRKQADLGGTGLPDLAWLYFKFISQ
jgi:hypothetical protein